MSALLDDVKARVLPMLAAERDRLAAAYPRLHFDAGTRSVGSLTDYQGHDVYLLCLFTDGREPSDLQLTFNLAYLTSAPRAMLDVAWGSGDVEASLPEVWERSSAWPPATAAVIDDLIAALPRLFGVFEDAVKRGYPIPADAS